MEIHFSILILIFIFIWNAYFKKYNLKWYCRKTNGNIIILSERLENTKLYIVSELSFNQEPLVYSGSRKYFYSPINIILRIFVRTSSTTSTLSTNTVCFVSTDTAPVTCKKRKRSLVIKEGAEGADSGVEINPSKTDIEGLEGSQKEGRLANNLLYWVTTTTTSTFTSYTATITIASVACTPAGSTLELCG